MLKNRERGDTLIEVLFATAVLALIIVIALTVMNAGTAQTERAVEGTFVRQAIDTQSELLRYERDSFVDGSPSVWSNIISRRVTTPPAFSSLAGNNGCKPTEGGAFYLTKGSSQGGYDIGSTFQEPQTFAGIGSDGKSSGLWVEASSSSSSANYMDFYIYACWSSTTSGPNATAGTIVRLYAPTN